MKLIHSGKVLKDDSVISTCGIKETDFLVVMVTKPKKPAAAAAPKVDTKAPAAAAAPAVDPTPKNETAAAGTETTTPAVSAPSAAAPPAPSGGDTFPAEVVTNLTSMGFPEAEVRHCLRAAHGNPDIAVEFLTNGIPEGVSEAANIVNATTAATPAAARPSGSGSGTGPLQNLRNHPQFDALRRLVQSNPGALQQVLTQIGQQQPELLAEINANQAAFLEMMNEPITDAPPAGAAAPGQQRRPGMGDPAQMAQMIQSMSDVEVAQMAAMMGLSPDQLRQTATMIGQMPADQLNQFMAQAMGGGGVGEMGGGQVLRLTEEEMAAVDRLTEMGFDRSDAAQAFLACDKNEALAANLLMDSMAGGGFFGGDDNNNNGSGGGGNGNDDDDDDEQMYE